MKKLLFAFIIIALAMWISSCSEEPRENPVGSDASGRVPANLPTNPVDPDVPEATVPLVTFQAPKDVTSISDLAEPAVLTPATYSATLRVGESAVEEKHLYIPENFTPPKLDLLICFDLTGSMGGELTNVKANGINIMNAVKAVVDDSYFGVISHMDYNGTFGGCGYGPYSYGSGPDYPYSRDQALTSSTADAATAINGLSLGYGDDGPEDYTRVFYESYADAGIGWREGSKKIVMAFGDAVPHDCAYDAILGGTATSGPDPGRDGAVGGGDDLEILPVLTAMAAENIALIAIHSGGSFDLWDAYAHETGGEAFQINYDGTIPGGTDIADFIAGLVEESIVEFDEVSLVPCDPAYADWVSVSPAAYFDVDLTGGWDGDFDVTFTVPDWASDGEYCFEICAIGDGIELATQEVCITVRSQRAFDVHPTSCPNPFNMTRTGVVPAAIVGGPEFDVATIDPASVRLEGLAPIRWEYEDVSTPYEPFMGKEDCMDCNTYAGDGYMDLTLKFDAVALAEKLGDVAHGDCKVVTMTADIMEDYGGGMIIGEDVLRIIIPKSARR